MPQYILYCIYYAETCWDFEISLVHIVQFSSGWSYGEQICEISKSHPLLKPYKGLSEKVSLFSTEATRRCLIWLMRIVLMLML